MKKTEEVDSILNILEMLYVRYEQEMVNMLWHKNLEKTNTKIELRDDIAYFLPQIMYPRLTLATTGSPTRRARPTP